MAEELKTIETVDTSPFKHLVMTLGELPTSFVDSMTYYECLAWLVNFIQNTVIPTVNNNAEAVEELQTAFVTLKKYVENYFENLDVQEEINNKLDEMAEDGTLQEIIASYIQAKVAWTFDTVAEMKTSTNLIDGSYAHTLGYHSLNDGGDAFYHVREVTNQDVIDEGKLIALQDQNLVAELIIENNVIDVKKFGAWADGVHDDSDVFQHCLDLVNTLTSSTDTWKRTIVVPAVLKITKKIECEFGNFRMEGVSRTNSKILLDNANAYLSFGKNSGDIYEIEIQNITFQGNYSNTNSLLSFTKCVNLYLTRVDTENQGQDVYGIEFNQCGLIFMDKCTITGSNNLTDYPGNRNGIKVTQMGSIFNFTNANCWNLNKVFTFVGSVQNINIDNNWIECYKSLIDFDCGATMSFMNVKIRNNTISSHHSDNFTPTSVSFISYDMKSNTNFYASSLDVSNNTIVFGNLTSINNNSLIYFSSIGGSGSSVFSIYFDRNVFSWQNLDTLNAYVFYNSESAFYTGYIIQIKSFDSNTNVDSSRITDDKKIIKCCLREGSIAATSYPNGIYLNNGSFTSNHGNLFYSAGEFYGGYAGSVKSLPKNVGNAIIEATSDNVVTVVNQIRTALFQAHITTLG